MTLTDTQLHSLARLGAIARLKALEDEATALRKMFPGLKSSQNAAPECAEPATKAKPRRRKQRSLASRRAARVRMKLYWAKKRGEQVPAGAAPEEKAEATALASTPVVPTRKKMATKKAKKASSPKKVKGAEKG